MGDNLVAARQFSGHCQAKVTALLRRKDYDPASAITALEAINIRAKNMRARSISRAAQTAIDEFTEASSPEKCTVALMALNQLIRQYTDGLDEVAPIKRFEMNEQKPSTSYKKAPTQDITLTLAKWKTARETFLPLQRFAKTERETSALAALAALSPFGSGTEKENFDLLMPAITDESLRQAREASKSVSLSYATDDIALDKNLAETVQDSLIEICRMLVQHTVEAPQSRVEQGLSSAAHIAITAKKYDDSFNILVSCEGSVSNKSFLKGKHIDALKSLGATLSIRSKSNLVCIDITNLPTSKVRPDPTLPEEVMEMRA